MLHASGLTIFCNNSNTELDTVDCDTKTLYFESGGANFTDLLSRTQIKLSQVLANALTIKVDINGGTCLRICRDCFKNFLGCQTFVYCWPAGRQILGDAQSVTSSRPSDSRTPFLGRHVDDATGLRQPNLRIFLFLVGQ